MARRNFTKPVKREALKRSAHRCEASGGLYGLSAGHRCNADLAYGVEFDHIDCDANSKDNSLENCGCGLHQMPFLENVQRRYSEGGKDASPAGQGQRDSQQPQLPQATGRLQIFLAHRKDGENRMTPTPALEAEEKAVRETLSLPQERAVDALSNARGEWLFFYQLEASGVRIQTLRSLRERGLIEARFQNGAISGPRSHMQWRRKP